MSKLWLIPLGYLLAVGILLYLIERANRDPVYDDQMRPVDPTKPTPTPGEPISTADHLDCPICGYRHDDTD